MPRRPSTTSPPTSGCSPCRARRRATPSPPWRPGVDWSTGGVPVPRGPAGHPRRGRRARHPDHLPRRARLGALRPGRPRTGRSGMPCSRRARRTASGPAACAPCRACGWRRATATTATTSTTPTTSTRSGSGSPWRSTSRAGSPGARRRWRPRSGARRTTGWCRCCSRTPSRCSFHAEPVLRDGVVVGYVRAASYGWTLGGAVGLAFVGGDEPVTPAVARRRLVGGRRRRHAPPGPRLAAPDVRPDERAGDGLTASAAVAGAGPPVWDDDGMPRANRRRRDLESRPMSGSGEVAHRVVCRQVVARAPAHRRVVVARVPVPRVPPGHRGRHGARGRLAGAGRRRHRRAPALAHPVLAARHAARP